MYHQGSNNGRCRYCNGTGLMEVWNKETADIWSFLCACSIGQEREARRRMTPVDERGNKVIEIPLWENKLREHFIPLAEQSTPPKVESMEFNLGKGLPDWMKPKNCR